MEILGKYVFNKKIGNTFLKYVKTQNIDKVLKMAFKDNFFLVKNKKITVDNYIENKNFLFKKFEITLSPIMIHFLNERQIENISTDFYQYLLLDIKNNEEQIFEKIENLLFHFSTLFYIMDKDTNKFYLDLNLRKNIKDKCKIIKNNKNINHIIELYSKELNIWNGDNFRCLFIEETQQLLIIINHLFVDGISWRLLMENFDKALNNNEIILEPTRFDMWSNQLLENTIIDSEVNYWNDIHNSIECFIDNKNNNNYSNKYCSFKSISIEISKNKLFINLRNHTLSKLMKTLFNLFKKDSIAVNIETHGREDITYINNLNDIFGWFTSFFPMVFKKDKYELEDIEKKFGELSKNGINYLLLKHNFIRNKHLTKPKNKTDVLFNFMGDFEYESNNFKLNKIGEQGDCGHILTFWFDIKYNNNNGCLLNCNLYYLNNHIEEKTINLLLDNLKENLIIKINFLSVF